MNRYEDLSPIGQDAVDGMLDGYDPIWRHGTTEEISRLRDLMTDTFSGSIAVLAAEMGKLTQPVSRMLTNVTRRLP